MLKFSRERQALLALRPLLKLVPGSIPLVVVFGVVTALSEGLSLSLFIPLFQSLTHNLNFSDSTILGRIWGFLVSGLSPEQIQWAAPLAILGLLGFKNGLAYLSLLLFSQFNWRISHRLRTTIFAQLLQVETQFLMAQDAGTLMNALDKEAWQATQALATLATLIISLCTLTVFTGFLLLISWRLTLLSLLMLFLVSTLVQRLLRQVKQLGQQATEANLQFVGRGFEVISGLQTIRLFGQQEVERQRFEQASLQVCSTFMQLDRLMGAISPVSEFAFAVLLTGLLIIFFKITTDLSIFITFLFILYRLTPHIRNLDAARAHLIALTASVKAVTELMAVTRKRQIISGNYPFTNLQQTIEFKNVTFQYQQGNDLSLRGLSFRILPGQTTAIVGPSGAGKSTIIGLILRQFDPLKGAVEVDGRPLYDYDLMTWRRNIAVVSQDIYLFNTSVKRNIAYGVPEASEATILAAAKMAHAHEFILEMPDGYDTVIGERGVRLSGGQRQRLALARALIRNPEILILDEATNALDSVSESLIQETLAAIGPERTMIVVAHRLSTIEKADQILVIQSGKLQEQGTLSELLEQNGLFARMYQLQMMSQAAS